jgi:hypothetical protein
MRMHQTSPSPLLEERVAERIPTIRSFAPYFNGSAPREGRGRGEGVNFRPDHRKRPDPGLPKVRVCLQGQNRETTSSVLRRVRFAQTFF